MKTKFITTKADWDIWNTKSNDFVNYNSKLFDNELSLLEKQKLYDVFLREWHEKRVKYWLKYGEKKDLYSVRRQMQLFKKDHSFFYVKLKHKKLKSSKNVLKKLKCEYANWLKFRREFRNKLKIERKKKMLLLKFRYFEHLKHFKLLIRGLYLYVVWEKSIIGNEDFKYWFSGYKNEIKRLVNLKVMDEYRKFLHCSEKIDNFFHKLDNFFNDGGSRLSNKYNIVFSNICLLKLDLIKDTVGVKKHLFVQNIVFIFMEKINSRKLILYNFVDCIFLMWTMCKKFFDSNVRK